MGDTPGDSTGRWGQRDGTQKMGTGEIVTWGNGNMGDGKPGGDGDREMEHRR